MKFWYKAVCDEHGEAIHILVRSNFWLFDPSKSLLAQDQKDEQRRVRWLEQHSECNLRLIHRDDEFDKLYELGGYHDPCATTCRCYSCKAKK